jgi:predicted DNA-binding protein (MmcQ/YjbR family)
MIVLMTRDELLAYCLAKPGAFDDFPWGEEDQVVKVGGKVFAFLGSPDAEMPGVSLKCGRTSEEAAELRHRYPNAVTPSAYVGRYGWNSITLDGSIPDDELLELVDASYEAAVAALPRSKRP